jgi:hypothetical protein
MPRGNTVPKPRTFEMLQGPVDLVQLVIRKDIGPLILLGDGVTLPHEVP